MRGRGGACRQWHDDHREPRERQVQEACPGGCGACQVARRPRPPARQGPESFMWVILQDDNFAPPKDCHLAWRLTAGELQKRAEAATEAEPAPKRR